MAAQAASTNLQTNPRSVTVHPRLLSGTVTVPASKSQGHRLLMAAALAGGESVIANLTHSKDIDATLACLTELGAEVSETAAGLRVLGMAAGPMGRRQRNALPRMDCGESGSTLRFLIPLALAVRGGGYFTGHGRLMERPLEPYFRLFDEKGVFYQLDGDTLLVRGTLSGGDFALPGDVSSQFITGLLYALPLLEGDSTLTLTTPLESAGYVDMTREALKTFGIVIEETESGYFIPGSQRYTAANAAVEGDWSQAGFWYAGLRLGNLIEVEGLSGSSRQGDRVITQQLVKLCEKGTVTLDVRDCPDLVPPLAAMGAFRAGEETVISGAARLRAKESDRLRAVTEVLSALGAEVEEGEDFLRLTGRDRLAGGAEIDPHNDHRIAMMAAMAATRCKEPVTILNPGCVEKSYPAFWDDYEKAGGKLQWNM